jgi:hypothetical protein
MCLGQLIDSQSFGVGIVICRGDCRHPHAENSVGVCFRWCSLGIFGYASSCLNGWSKGESNLFAERLFSQVRGCFDPGIVEREFTEPATSPALLRVQARRGTHAVWVPPLGDEENAGQMELLFLPTALVPILDVDRRERCRWYLWR